MNAQKKKSKVIRYLLYTMLILLLLGILLAWKAYQLVFTPNVALNRAESFIYIASGSDYEQVLLQIKEQQILKDPLAFDWVARLMEYPERVKAGRYRIRDGWNNKELLSLLRSGRQEPVNLVIRPVANLQTLASIIGRNMEADSNSFISLLNNTDTLRHYGIKPETAMSFFIPNTYQLYWNTDASKVLQRLLQEYSRFWQQEGREEKAVQLNMSHEQVSTLASIVEKETQKRDEMHIVAGVYINRLRVGNLLEADPTVIFAAADPAIRRVTKALLQIESPYNTYRHKGLPPGPICVPSVAAIDAVLNYERHKYMFFCAREDFSGYHNFAENLDQHLVNARKYQRELNKRKIFK